MFRWKMELDGCTIFLRQCVDGQIVADVCSAETGMVVATIKAESVTFPSAMDSEA